MSAVVFAVSSVLLRYPDERLLADLPALTRATAAATVPQRARQPLARFLDYLANTALDELQQHYVAIFDLKRRCCLYLTYYLHGDTRRRGAALVGFKQVYRNAGLAPIDGELPDFLPTVLEFAALTSTSESGPMAGGPGPAIELLQTHRRGLSLLRLALEQAGSPYADVISAVDRVLPPARRGELEAAVALAAQGPPVEMVGLRPYPAAAGERRAS